MIIVLACKSSYKHSHKGVILVFNMYVDLSDKGLRNNLYYCACWLIGGYENALSDYGEDSEEGKEAKEWLSDRQQMIADILSDGTALVYAEGFEGIPTNNKLADAYSKYPSDTVLRWVEEAIDKVRS